MLYAYHYSSAPHWILSDSPHILNVHDLNGLTKAIQASNIPFQTIQILDMQKRGVSIAFDLHLTDEHKKVLDQIVNYVPQYLSPFDGKLK